MRVAAQIDPQSLVGVWEGTYENTAASRPASILFAISRFEGGRVYIRQETIGDRVNPPFNYVSRLTPTGFSHTTSEGHTARSVLEDDKMHFTQMTRWGAIGPSC